MAFESGRTSNTSLSDSAISIPARETVNTTLSPTTEPFTEQTYQTYFRPIYRTLTTLDPDELIPVTKLYTAIDKDVTDATKWSYITRVLRYEPTLATHLVDRLPPADVLVALAASRLDTLDTTPPGIPPSQMNAVKQECVAYTNACTDRYRTYLNRQLVHEAMTAAEKPRPHPTDELITSAALDAFLDRLETELITRLGTDHTSDIESLRQSLFSIGGEANEQIVLETLRYEGLVTNEDFVHTTTGQNSDVDIQIHPETGDSLQIEVKSETLRERTDSSLARVDGIPILVGFFTNPTEVAQKAHRLREECVAAYIPPDTLTALENPMDDGFFRPNTAFASDAATYVDDSRAIPWDGVV